MRAVHIPLNYPSIGVHFPARKPCPFSRAPCCAPHARVRRLHACHVRVRERPPARTCPRCARTPLTPPNPSPNPTPTPRHPSQRHTATPRPHGAPPCQHRAPRPTRPPASHPPHSLTSPHPSLPHRQGMWEQPHEAKERHKTGQGRRGRFRASHACRPEHCAPREPLVTTP